MSTLVYLEEKKALPFKVKGAMLRKKKAAEGCQECGFLQSQLWERAHKLLANLGQPHVPQFLKWGTTTFMHKVMRRLNETAWRRSVSALHSLQAASHHSQTQQVDSARQEGLCMEPPLAQQWRCHGEQAPEHGAIWECLIPVPALPPASFPLMCSLGMSQWWLGSLRSLGSGYPHGQPRLSSWLLWEMSQQM